MLLNIALILFAYLLGSLSSAIITCQIMALEDPRKGGSCNPGATNVMRLYGKKAAITTLVGDVLKGTIPVVLCKLLGGTPMIIAISGLAAFMGHLYPLFFRFQGGKGVATLIGVLAGSCYLCALAFVTTWLIVALISRYSALSALVATAMTLLYTAWLLPSAWYLLANSIMAVLLFWRHRWNIKNLIAGTEDKITNNG